MHLINYEIVLSLVDGRLTIQTSTEFFQQASELLVLTFPFCSELSTGVTMLEHLHLKKAQPLNNAVYFVEVLQNLMFNLVPSCGRPMCYQITITLEEIMQALPFGEAAPPLMFIETMSILLPETSILPHHTYFNVKKDNRIKLSLLNQMSVLSQKITPIQSWPLI